MTLLSWERGGRHQRVSPGRRASTGGKTPGAKEQTPSHPTQAGSMLRAMAEVRIQTAGLRFHTCDQPTLWGPRGPSTHSQTSSEGAPLSEGRPQGLGGGPSLAGTRSPQMLPPDRVSQELPRALSPDRHGNQESTSISKRSVRLRDACGSTVGPANVDDADMQASREGKVQSK